MTEFIEMTPSEWEAKFKPITNHITPNSFTMFETYGDDLDFVNKQDNHYIWTSADGDYCTYISNGYHYVNRIAYYITEVPWEDDKEYQIITSTEEQCECYDEDREDNDGEFGDPSCEECEGYGMITRYVD